MISAPIAAGRRDALLEGREVVRVLLQRLVHGDDEEDAGDERTDRLRHGVADRAHHTKDGDGRRRRGAEALERHVLDGLLRLVVEARDDLMREVLERAESRRRVVGELARQLRVRELDGLEQRCLEGRALLQLEGARDAIALDKEDLVVFVEAVEVRFQSS